MYSTCISIFLLLLYHFAQVYDRLQKLGLCLSHSATSRLITKLGLVYDCLVHEWKDTIEEDMLTCMQVLKINVYSL